MRRTLSSTPSQYAAATVLARTSCAHTCTGGFAASGLVFTRDFSRIRCAGDNGKYQKDRRVKRLKNWTRKQERRQAERQAAAHRLGTDDIEWYEGEYYPRAELEVFMEERRQALRAATARILPESDSAPATAQ